MINIDSKEKVFGEKLKDVQYKDRIGVYGILFNSEGQVAAIKTPTGYFLPGGGLEEEECHEACIKRECAEELGFKVSVKEYLGKASYYHISKTSQYLHGIGHFYIIDMVSEAPAVMEDNNELVWLEPMQCAKVLFLEHQAWAVMEAVKIN